MMMMMMMVGQLAEAQRRTGVQLLVVVGVLVPLGAVRAWGCAVQMHAQWLLPTSLPRPSIPSQSLTTVLLHGITQQYSPLMMSAYLAQVPGRYGPRAPIPFDARQRVRSPPGCWSVYKDPRRHTAILSPVHPPDPDPSSQPSCPTSSTSAPPPSSSISNRTSTTS